MALLWMDGFDHYGTDETNLLDGVYVERDASVAIDTVHVRTGSYSLRCPTTIGPAGAVRRIFGGAKSSAGVGMAVWIDSMPSGNDFAYLWALCDTGNKGQVILILQSTGKVSAYRVGATSAFGMGLEALLAESEDGALVASAFQHVEVKAGIHTTNGFVEVRVNGVTVLTASGVNTQSASAAGPETSQVRIYGTADTVNPPPQVHIDDMFAYDLLGSQNNDFLGDRRVRTFFPNADTAVADWAKVGAALGYDCINDSQPDDDSTYISAAPITDSPPTPVTSEFGVEDAPDTIGSIAAVQTYVLARKTQAGVAKIQSSIVSGVDVSGGTEWPITEQYTYYMDVHEVNPATGTPWSEGSISAAKLRIARVE